MTERPRARAPRSASSAAASSAGCWRWPPRGWACTPTSTTPTPPPRRPRSPRRRPARPRTTRRRCAAFAASVDVVTYEFENVPLAAIDVIEALAPMRPGRRALEVARPARREGLSARPRPRHRALRGGRRPRLPARGAGDDRAAGDPEDPDARLRRQGAGADRRRGARPRRAWPASAGAPAILEGFVAFEREISVIAARGLDGAVAAFDPGENVHEDGILRTTTVPAPVSPARSAPTRC